MTLSEEQKQQREEIEQRKEQMRKNIFDEEVRQLDILSNNIIDEFRNEIDQIIEWTHLKLKGVLFDSQFCNWEIGSSTFEQHVEGKDKVMFLIITETGIKYGGFLYSKAVVRKYNKETKQYYQSFDSKYCLYTFLDNPQP